MRKGLRTLIICTKGGLSVWENHLVRMGVDKDRILTINPLDRSVFDAELLETGAASYDYYILHWNALLLVEGLYQPGVRNIVWDHVIADEAHLAKNRKAERTLRLKKIKTHVRTAVTGTPADDKPQDMWSVLNWLDKKTWSSYWDFFNEYIDWEMGYSRGNVNGYRKILGTKNISKLHDLIRPFYIRRSLNDVIDDMPDKTHDTMYVELTPRQRRDYDDMHKWQVARLGVEEEALVVTARIAMFVRLGQMTAGTCTLDWTRHDESVKKLKEWEEVWGSLPVEERPVKLRRAPKILSPTVIIGDPSPKIDLLMELIETAPEDEQFVVFTNYKGVVDLVEARCRKEKVSVVTYTGAITSQKTRDAHVARFQSGSARVFVGTVDAAGTSITLTAAHTLIFLDRHWNPSKDEQAEDRIFRIGQKNACRIIDIIARDTYDEPRVSKIWDKADAVREMVEVEEWLPTYAELD